MATEETEQQPLEEQLVARVREWFKRAAPLTKDHEVPEITIRLKDASEDDDGTFYLYADIDEKCFDQCEGRVPGERLR